MVVVSPPTPTDSDPPIRAASSEIWALVLVVVPHGSDRRSDRPARPRPPSRRRCRSAWLTVTRTFGMVPHCTSATWRPLSRVNRFGSGTLKSRVRPASAAPPETPPVSAARPLHRRFLGSRLLLGWLVPAGLRRRLLRRWVLEIGFRRRLPPKDGGCRQERGAAHHGNEARARHVSSPSLSARWSGSSGWSAEGIPGPPSESSPA